ncbi:MAG TPA: prepilin-type N-terminal cleavage/methylation domain-containing protein [Polyangiaceae bacterium]|nr:prepilin-type N-terminal cleavage/methylation domain-containing protein [Polyangiaceae bacterium]
MRPFLPHSSSSLGESLRSVSSEDRVELNRLGTSRSRSAKESWVRKLGEAGRLLWFSKRESQGTISPSAERKSRNNRTWVRKLGEAGRLLWFSKRGSPGAISPSAERKKRKLQEAFSLLEVLVAIAILGLGLTVILSSQAGLFSSASRGEHLTVASNLLRCKMSELELECAQKGFNLTDETDEGPCCDDESDGYACSWKVERVELPPLPESSGTEGDAGAGEPASMGALDTLANLRTTQGASLGDNAGLGSLAEQLAPSGSGGGIEGIVMGFVYPSLKPMLEASIRRVTVTVKWKEGVRERELTATQFLTRPQEGELGTLDQLGLDGGVPGDPLGGGVLGGGSRPASRSPTKAGGVR